MNKVCTRCNISKPISNFNEDTRYKDGYNGWCKSCMSINTTDYKRKKASGLTREEYTRMFDSQGGTCAICGTHQDFLKRELAVDHDHKTGFVRALLCGRCNMGLGYFKDNPARLRKAAEYLETYKAGADILSEYMKSAHEAGIIEENEPLTSGE